MSLYPHITYYNGTEIYSDGNHITKGYYVRAQKEDGKYYITPLDEWFKNR